VLINFSVLP